MNSLWWFGVKIDYWYRYGVIKVDLRRGGGRYFGGVWGGGCIFGLFDYFVWFIGMYICILYLFLYLYVLVWNCRVVIGFDGFIFLFYSDKGYVINCFVVIIFVSMMFFISNCRNSLFVN